MLNWLVKWRKLLNIISLIYWLVYSPVIAKAISEVEVEETVTCEMLIVGGGLAGVGAAYEGLLAGKTVCMTEITDWVGGQISAQGTSALDETTTQRSLLFYSRGYLELRERIANHYGRLNPGECWVSESCFLPKDGHKLLWEQLKAAEQQGNGTLKWFPSTVIKELAINDGGKGSGEEIRSAIAIQHQPAVGAPANNTLPLSENLIDWYQYEDSANFQKTIIRFIPHHDSDWYIIDATETGEIIALADVPYRVGIDPRSHLEPSSSSVTANPYCTQGFTYTFAMEKTEEQQSYPMPEFYLNHAHYYSYERERFTDFDLLFTYRRILSPNRGKPNAISGIYHTTPTVGDISMQNWTWGNDYRPGTAQDNLIYTRGQLAATGQLEPGGWLGGLRIATLSKAEDHALGFFYWIVAGTTDSQLGPGVKEPLPYYRLLTGNDSPMGTAHGLSKYPYIREGRRIIGRPSFAYPDGFVISEIDISRRNFQTDYYRQVLSPDEYRRLQLILASQENGLAFDKSVEQITRRQRSTIYPDAVGIGHYAIDFHPCMEEPGPERCGNRAKPGEGRGSGQAYPFQIPLRALIPQKVDNMLVAGKGIATSHIAAGAYRVHSFEWSSGAAAGITVNFALEKGILPYQLLEKLPQVSEHLRALQQRLNDSGNPTAFPNTSIFNESWDEWR